jgi:hypothetical protein
VAIEVPRVQEMGKEVPLESYRQLRQSDGFDERVFSLLINGLAL